MTFRTGYVRKLMASAALVALVALAGCETDGLRSGKAMKELSPEMKAELTAKNMPIESPILVRLFKQEAELEVWKQDASGRYALLKTYPICRWSGELGPKIKEGDRQAPEGFYNITPASMNPNSQFYLSINTGYPNAYDKANHRTGSALMIHGDCSSRGCYAMTDDQISEIYALGRESFFGGQRSLQLQAYPFRMTPANFAKHRNNPNMPFWKMLKEGNDHFEVTHQEPKVDVCDKRYVFNAEPKDGASSSSVRLGTPWGGIREQPQQSSAALNFSPAGKCPSYQVPEEVRDAVAAKRRQDEQQIASLIPRTSAAPAKTGRDGGMHPTFLAQLRPQEVRESDGTVRYVVDENAAKKLGSYVVPPLETEPVSAGAPATAVASTPARDTAKKKSSPATYAVASAESREVPAPAPRAPESSGNMFSSLFSAGSDQPPPPPSKKDSGMLGRVKSFFVGDDEPQRKAAPATTQKASTAKESKKSTSKATPKSRAKSEPAEEAEAPAAAPAPTTTSANAGLLNGAAPTVPSGNFDSRWGAIR